MVPSSAKLSPSEFISAKERCAFLCLGTSGSWCSLRYPDWAAGLIRIALLGPVDQQPNSQHSEAICRSIRVARKKEEGTLDGDAVERRDAHPDEEEALNRGNTETTMGYSNTGRP